MTDSLSVTVDGPYILIGTIDDDVPHHRYIAPGSFAGGAWVDTDLSSELPAVKEAAAGAWTQPVVTAFREQMSAELALGQPSPSEAVNQERNRRIVAGKTINGIAVTGRDEDARNMTNLALAAQLRIGTGDTTTLTTFRDGNNVDHDLTPPQMLDLWQLSAAYVSALYEASWALKAMNPIPADFAQDNYWP